MMSSTYGLIEKLVRLSIVHKLGMLSLSICDNRYAMAAMVFAADLL